MVLNRQSIVSQPELFNNAPNGSRNSTDNYVSLNQQDDSRHQPLAVSICDEEYGNYNSFDETTNSNKRVLFSFVKICSALVSSLQGQVFFNWSLWLSSFGVCNIALYHFFSILFVGEVNHELISSRIAVYTIILCVIALTSAAALIGSFFTNVNSLNSNISSRSLLSISLTTVTKGSIFVVVSYFLIKSIYLGFYSIADELAAKAAENAVFSVCVYAWWIALRNVLAILAAERIGYTAFDRGVSESDLSDSNYPLESDGSKYRNQQQSYPNVAVSDESEVVRGEMLYTIGEGSVLRQSMVIKRGLSLIEQRESAGAGSLVIRQSGDVVLAGSRVVKGRFSATAIERAADKLMHWFVERLNCLLLEVQNEPQKFRQTILLGTFIVAICLGLIAYFSGLMGATGSIYDLLKLSILDNIFTAFSVVIILDVFLFQYLQKPLSMTKLFFKGVMLSSSYVFSKLARVNSVSFRVQSADSGVGSAKVIDFQLIDQRIDRSQLLSVVFALLRNGEDRLAQAVREYCFIGSAQQQLFNVEGESQTNSGVICGTIQGIQFLFGSEQALLESGVHLDLSDTLDASINTKNSDRTEKLFLAIGKDVVARFLVKLPFFAEMSSVVADLRSMGIKPVLVSNSIEQEDLDELGKEVGFYTTDIHVEPATGVVSSELRGIEIFNRAHAGNTGTMKKVESDLEVLFEPADEQIIRSSHEQSYQPLIVTWFRPALWNLNHVGVLMTDKNLISVSDVLRRARKLQSISTAYTILLPILIIFFISLTFVSGLSNSLILLLICITSLVAKAILIERSFG